MHARIYDRRFLTKRNARPQVNQVLGQKSEKRDCVSSVFQCLSKKYRETFDSTHYSRLARISRGFDKTTHTFFPGFNDTSWF